jgi:class 3 adenylate cyclase/tetratricopeptide (TPR) repeat protein
LDKLTAYLPPDRAQALLAGTPLPSLQDGTVLFADLAGFTPLTEALLHAHGPRQGAEMLAEMLNQVYTALIATVGEHGGSVISFSGDAITCWFAADDGRRALACAFAMQTAMDRVGQPVALSGLTDTLSVKIAIAAGGVHRWLVGDPRHGLIDVLAGSTLDQLAAIEQCARPGEIILDGASARRWREDLAIAAWRDCDLAGGPAALVTGWGQAPPAADPAPAPPDASGPALPDDDVRPWLIPAIWTRFQEGLGEFLTELRPAVALFLRFSGLAYESDTEAGATLNRFVGWVQQVADQFGGTLLQLTIGDKGSYAYLCFGAPIAHEDDPLRALMAANQLLTPPDDCAAIHSIQIGISSGTMRAGAYGSAHRRTYGALGDAVNIAARLMQHARPGQILVDDSIVARLGSLAEWEPLPPVALKGKADPLAVYSAGPLAPPPAQRRPARDGSIPLIGREDELGAMLDSLEQALAGRGQVLQISGEAGIGKSRLVAAFAEQAGQRGLSVYQGSGSSYGMQTPYLIWQSIWRAFFELPDSSADQLAAQLAQIDPDFPLRLPLLNPVLSLDLPETDLTRNFDARLRKDSREALLVECLRHRARRHGAEQSGLVVILEDAHWMDGLSHDLLAAISRILANLPVLLVLVARPPEAGATPWPDPARLQAVESLALAALTPEAAGQLSAATLTTLGYGEASLPPARLDALMARTQGNPFYVEEVLHYLHAQGVDLWQADGWEAGQLPLSLETAILSRVDHLPGRQQRLLKPAAIIGLDFAVDWLCGYYPQLGGARAIAPDLADLQSGHLLRAIPAAPELTYGFHHGLTQEVIYGSLPEATRSQLHEQLGGYLETALGTADPQVSLLAFHYGRSHNSAKQRHYLRRAGDLAREAYANDAAIAAYEALLPLVTDPAERSAIIASLGRVLGQVGQLDRSRTQYEEVILLGSEISDEAGIADAERMIGGLLIERGRWVEAMPYLERSAARCLRIQDFSQYYRVTATIGECLYRQGAIERARNLMETALNEARALEIPMGIAGLLNNLANICQEQGNFTMAERYLQECLEIDKNSNYAIGILATSLNLAIIACEQGNFAKADPYYTRGLHLARQTGNKFFVGHLLMNWGNTAIAQGDYATAQGRLEEALMIAREVAAQRTMVYALDSLGVVAVAHGNFDQAQILLTEALTIAQNLQVPRAVALVMQTLSDLAREQGQEQGSFQYLAQSIDVAEPLGLAPIFIQIFVRVATLIAQHGDDGMRDSARLAATSKRYLTESRSVLDFHEQTLLDRTIALAQQKLADDVFRACWAEGEAMDLAAGIACARRWTAPPAPSADPGDSSPAA